LSQQSPEDNKWHPVAFLSKSLSLVEQNYEIHDKEMLAIVTLLALGGISPRKTHL